MTTTERTIFIVQIWSMGEEDQAKKKQRKGNTSLINFSFIFFSFSSPSSFFLLLRSQFAVMSRATHRNSGPPQNNWSLFSSYDYVYRFSFLSLCLSFFLSLFLSFFLSLFLSFFLFFFFSFSSPRAFFLLFCFCPFASMMMFSRISRSAFLWPKRSD